MSESSNPIRRPFFAIAAAFSMASASLVSAAESKAQLQRPSGYAWVLICANAGNYYLNLVTGEKRSTPDGQHVPCDNSACHSVCRRRISHDDAF